MDYLTKHPKLVQFGALMIVFFILMSITGEYASYLELRDGFGNKLNPEKYKLLPVFQILSV